MTDEPDAAPAGGAEVGRIASRPRGATLGSVTIAQRLDPGESLAIARLQARQSLIALLGGLLLAGFGGLLVWLGVEGALDWTFSGLGVSSKLAKASPGVALVVAGVLIAAVNRFSVTIGPAPAARRARRKPAGEA